MAKYLSNGDKILQSVLTDEHLISSAEYNPDDYETIEDALMSSNAIVCAIAKIIDGKERNLSEKELYNVVNNYLKDNI
ncbi:MAG: hypothetical protein PHF41_07430 [Massilibacteroides sp.]|nr:hypothetical protein [Massilibacteroides sp.]MDD4532030.1 hypothetical protein [Bacilli bacterium]